MNRIIGIILFTLVLNTSQTCVLAKNKVEKDPVMEEIILEVPEKQLLIPDKTEAQNATVEKKRIKKRRQLDEDVDLEAIDDELPENNII